MLARCAAASLLPLHRIDAPTAAAVARGSGEGLGNCGALLADLGNGVGFPAEGAGDGADCKHAPQGGGVAAAGDCERRGDLDADPERIGADGPARIREPRSGSPATGPHRGPVQATTSAKQCSRQWTRRVGARRPWCRGVSDRIDHPAGDDIEPALVEGRGDAVARSRAPSMPMAVPPRPGVSQEPAPRLRGRLAQTSGTCGRTASTGLCQGATGPCLGAEPAHQPGEVVPNGTSAASSRISPRAPCGCGSWPRRDSARMWPRGRRSRRPRTSSTMPRPVPRISTSPSGPSAAPVAAPRAGRARPPAPPLVRRPRRRCRGRPGHPRRAPRGSRPRRGCASAGCRGHGRSSPSR